VSPSVDSLTLRMRAVGAAQAAGDVAAVRKEVDSFSKHTDRLIRHSRRMQAFGRSWSRHISLPIVGLGAVATKMSVDFSTAMGHISALVGPTAGDINMLRKGVLDLAGTTTQSPTELADALYFLTSSGLKGKQALDALKWSAKGASAGLGDTQTVADVVSAAMNAYGHGAETAKDATDTLIATVREGKGDPQELAASLGRIMPYAAQLEVPMRQLGGAIAGLTLAAGGKANAAEQVTGLRQVMQKMIRPTRQGNKVLAKYRLNLEDVQKSIKERGFLGTMIWLRKAFHGNTQDLSKYLNTAEGFRVFLQMTGKHAKDTARAYDGVMSSANDTAKAQAAMAKTPGYRAQQALNKLRVQAIKLGDVLLPTLLPAFERVAGDLEAIGKWFQRLSPQQQSVILKFVALAAILGPLIVVAGTVAGAILNIRKALLILRATQLGSWASTLFTPVRAQVPGLGASIGRIFGLAFGIAAGVLIASEIAKALHQENMDPLLFLHPPSASGHKRADGTYQDTIPKGFNGGGMNSDQTVAYFRKHPHEVDTGVYDSLTQAQRTALGLSKAVNATGGEIVIHNHVNVDGKTVAKSTHRAAVKKKSTR
jgi:TP901 family phage tail tape measure protein